MPKKKKGFQRRPFSLPYPMHLCECAWIYGSTNQSKRAHPLPGHLLAIYHFILEKQLLEELTNAPPRA